MEVGVFKISLNMRAILMILVFFSCSSCINPDLKEYCGQFSDSIPSLKFEGVGGEFHMKIKEVVINKQDTIDLICAKINELKQVHLLTGKGADWVITFYDPNGGRRYLLEVYKKSSPVKCYVFRLGVKYYENDSLARLFEEIIDLNDIRNNEKYRIEEW